MRIMAMIPGEGGLAPGNLAEELRRWKNYAMQFASAGTDIEMFPTGGVKYVRHGRDMLLIVPSAVETAVQGEQDGFDAVLLFGT